MNILCPVCRRELLRYPKYLQCENGHLFDLAKEGYVNLLRSNSGIHQPGDNREMIAARRDFHSHDYYRALRERVCSAVSGCNGTLIDCGCGEGYYTDAMQKSLPAVGFFGVDISKNALKLAAKSNKDVFYIVASSFDLPFADQSADAVTNIFAPLPKDEAYRVLTPGGLLINVTPAERHLWQMKEILYENPYPNACEAIAVPGFSEIGKEKVEDTISLDRDSVRSLFLMTPYSYKTSADAVKRLLDAEKLNTEIAFVVTVYRKD